MVDRNDQVAGFPPHWLSMLLLVAAATLAAVVALLSSRGSAPLLAQQPTATPTPVTITRIDPSSQKVGVGTPVGAGILVENIVDPDGLGAYEITLNFSPEVLAYSSVSFDFDFIQSTGRFAFCLVDTDDIATGQVTFGCATSGANSGPTGGGLLATVNFATSCAGVAALDFASALLTDPLASLGGIPTQIQNGSATVNGAPPCGPPLPTSTPGPATPTFTPSPSPTDGPSPTPTNTPTAGPSPTPAPALCSTGGTAVCISPVLQNTTVGSIVTAHVAVANVSDLGAFQFDLLFNSGLLRPTDSRPVGQGGDGIPPVVLGGFLGSTGRSPICLPTVAPDRIQYACVTLGGGPAQGGMPGASGNGILADVNLKATSIGLSPVHFDVQHLLLTTIGGTLINVSSVQDGIISVGTGPPSTPTATNTPAPTSTVGPSPTPTPTGPTPTAGPAPTVSVQPASQTVAQGTDVVVDIAISGVSNLGAYEFELAYDRNVLSFVSALDGPFLASSGRFVTCLPPDVDAIAGVVRFGCTTLGASPAGPSGSGVLSTVRFANSCAGGSVLDLRQVELAPPLIGVDPAIPSPALQDGSATITGATPCPTPVATVTPTSASSVTPPTNTPTSTATPGTPGPTATFTAIPPVSPTPTSAPTLCGPAGHVMCVLPPSQTITRGSQTTVSIAVDGSPEMGGFQFTLNANPSIVSILSVQMGPFIGSTNRVPICFAPVLQAGNVQYVCVTQGASLPGPTGSGVLATVTLRGDVSGLTPLTLEDAVTVAPSGVIQNPGPALQGGGIFVFQPPAAPTPTPSSTPTITLSPTPSLTPTPCPGGVCPTSTPTFTPSITSTPTNTNTPSSTATPSGTPTPSATPTITPTVTPTFGALTMAVQPVSQSVTVGNQTTVNIVGSNYQNLGAFQFTLEFNPSVASFVSMQVGNVFAGTTRTVLCPTLNVQANSVEFVCITLGAGVGPSGIGTFATATFAGAGQGISPLHLTNAFMTNIQGSVLGPLTTQDGALSVTVSAASSGGESPLYPVVLARSGQQMAVSGLGDPGRGIQSGSAAVFKDPPGANLFLGAGPLVIEERVTGVPAGLGLGAFELQVLFNANAVDVQITEGPFLGSTGRETHCLTGNAEGSVHLSCFSLGAQPGPSGGGVLALLTVTPAQGLQLRSAPGNGIQVLLDDVSAVVRLNDTAGNPVPLSQVGDSTIIERALEGDVNVDCQVNVIDQQLLASRFGAQLGSLLYEPKFDLEPSLQPDGDIDISDVQVVFGRIGSTCGIPHPPQSPPLGQPTPTPKSGTGPTPTPTITVTPSPTQTPLACLDVDFDGDTICDDVDPDDDNDGCTDQTELGTNASLGGLRDPHNFWDFFDMPNPSSTPMRDGAVSVGDILLVVARFGRNDAGGTAVINRNTNPLTALPTDGYHPAYDRTLLGPNGWNLGPPNGSITVEDILYAVAQFGHACAT
ncbi:MAG: flexitail domain-containing putative surface protein [Dehalococcoidia bacterium]